MSLLRPSRVVTMLAAAAALAAFAAPASAQHDHAHHGAQARAEKNRVERSDHPEPRPNVTAQDVLRVDQLENERQKEAYEIARKIPHVLDGLFCHCNCHEVRGKRSLLECYHSDMAARCGICMGEARLAWRLHQQGRTLEEIREAIDRQYGG
ncbi:MAG TPA: CYCXC family (seleno)protein [Longimicrobium sp.]|nr:CYCXC family (seleno)protein [Longimicrobium sp.]